MNRHENRTLCYEGQCEKDMPHGYCEDGTYEGPWGPNLSDGEGKLFSEDGMLCYQGQLKKDMPHG